MRAWNVFISFFFFLVLISTSISDRRLISYLTLFVLVSFLTCSFILMIVFVNHCQFFLLRNPGPAIDMAPASMFFPLLPFLSCYGVKAAVMGENRQRKGNDLSLFMSSDRICHSMESGPSIFTFGSSRKYHEKNQINHFAHQLPCPWHLHDLLRATCYYFSLAEQHI